MSQILRDLSNKNMVEFAKNILICFLMESLKNAYKATPRPNVDGITAVIWTWKSG